MTGGSCTAVSQKFQFLALALEKRIHTKILKYTKYCNIVCPCSRNKNSFKIPLLYLAIKSSTGNNSVHRLSKHKSEPGFSFLLPIILKIPFLDEFLRWVRIKRMVRIHFGDREKWRHAWFDSRCLSYIISPGFSLKIESAQSRGPSAPQHCSCN